MDADYTAFRKYAKHIKKYRNENNATGLRTMKLSIIHDPRLTAASEFILLSFIDEALEYI